MFKPVPKSHSSGADKPLNQSVAHSPAPDPQLAAAINALNAGDFQRAAQTLAVLQEVKE